MRSDYREIHGRNGSLQLPRPHRPTDIENRPLSPVSNLSEPEMDWVREYRWWAVNSLATADILVEPERIAEGLQNLISRGLPSVPIDIDVLS